MAAIRLKTVERSRKPYCGNYAQVLIKAMIHKSNNAKAPNPEFDSYLYKLRHLVENMFAGLKHFRSIVTHYEKLARNFKSMLYLSCTIVHYKMN